MLNNDGRIDEEQKHNRTKENMFFLSPVDSGPSSRFCYVPPGCKILIPSLCVVATGDSEEGAGERPKSGVDDLIRFNEVDQENVAYRWVEIDGMPIPERDLDDQFRTRVTERFEVKFPKPSGSQKNNNKYFPIFNATPGKCWAVADGVYLLWKLPPESRKKGGKKDEKRLRHTIQFGGKINLSDEKESIETTSYTEDVTYILV
jgi:hypothetical protein